MVLEDFFNIDSFRLAKVIQSIETPVYVYNAHAVINNLNFLTATLSSLIKQKLLIRYAVKANSNNSILKLVAQHGAGVEVVSGGELRRALRASIPTNRIVFSGVGKTREELEFATNEQIEQISVESIEELTLLASLSKKANLCLRLCPNITALTHDKITTGRSCDKFGIALDQLPDAYSVLKANPQLNFLGFSVHIGSQIQSTEPFRETFKILAKLLRDMPGGLEVKRLDLGGGFFVPYHDHEKPFDWKAYAEAILEELGDFQGELVIEPGRFLVANAGVLLTKILYIKKTSEKTFIIVDAGMNDMMRTALYGVQHAIVPVNPSQDSQTQRVDVVGPVCESSDYFAKDIDLPLDLKQGDYLAVTCTGAYGASLSSTYNSRPLIAEVLIDNKRPYLIREAISADYLSTFEPIRLCHET